MLKRLALLNTTVLCCFIPPGHYNGDIVDHAGLIPQSKLHSELLRMLSNLGDFLDRILMLALSMISRPCYLSRRNIQCRTSWVRCVKCTNFRVFQFVDRYIQGEVYGTSSWWSNDETWNGIYVKIWAPSDLKNSTPVVAPTWKSGTMSPNSLLTLRMLSRSGFRRWMWMRQPISKFQDR